MRGFIPPRDDGEAIRARMKAGEGEMGAAGRVNWWTGIFLTKDVNSSGTSQPVSNPSSLFLPSGYSVSHLAKVPLP